MIEMSESMDRKGNPYLEVRYYDYDAQYLREIHYLNSKTSLKKFHINFLRSHLKRPEKSISVKSPQDVVDIKGGLRMPKFVIARKQDKFWKITEKIFVEEVLN